jgi:hypothetical protein
LHPTHSKNKIFTQKTFFYTLNKCIHNFYYFTSPKTPVVVVVVELDTQRKELTFLELERERVKEEHMRFAKNV